MNSKFSHKTEVKNYEVLQIKYKSVWPLVLTLQVEKGLAALAYETKMKKIMKVRK
jgi:hypothetical protein